MLRWGQCKRTLIACDFLKGVGLTAYAKPDVHVKRALYRNCLTSVEKADDFTCFVEVDRLAQASGLEPAYIDRILWLRGQKFKRWELTWQTAYSKAGG